MSTLLEAAEAIRKINNPDDLRALYAEVKRQEAYLATRTARGLSVGDAVKFRARNGCMVTGKVTKKNRKTVEVLGSESNGIFTTRYRVPASLLETV
jgi:hypothetical protein